MAPWGAGVHLGSHHDGVGTAVKKKSITLVNLNSPMYNLVAVWPMDVPAQGYDG